MCGINKVILMGVVTVDWAASPPDVFRFSVQTYQEEMERQPMAECRERLAAICAKYLTTGRAVYLEGKLVVRDDGSAAVEVDTLQLLRIPDGAPGEVFTNEDPVAFQQLPSGRLP